MPREVQYWMRGESTGEVAAVGLRDWTVLAGAAVLALLDGWAVVRAMPPTVLGKLTTGLQFAFIVAVFWDDRAADYLRWPTIAVSGAAAVDYVRVAVRRRAAAR